MLALLCDNIASSSDIVPKAQCSWASISGIRVCLLQRVYLAGSREGRSPVRMRRVVQAGSRLLNASSVLRASTQSGLSTNSRLYSSESITCTLFPGDGIGPEIADAVRIIFEAAKAPIDWDEQFIGKVADPRTNSMVTRENLDSVLVRCFLYFL